eukprot:TRINITY_DN6476_c0_g2_i1.p1 TRINITY_DN6476_c0_g2~~TRINITY_DN6476_c0_g2_i1.p1  ORF type:complete len:113 (-),score=7.98 TRINITY_DN6476_c0_g2_i1:311-649(-)
MGQGSQADFERMQKNAQASAQETLCSGYCGRAESVQLEGFSTTEEALAFKRRALVDLIVAQQAERRSVIAIVFLTEAARRHSSTACARFEYGSMKSTLQRSLASSKRKYPKL